MSIKQLLTDIADAIRRGTGKTDGLTLSQMPAEIDTIADNVLKRYLNHEIEDLKIPAGVESIGRCAFAYRTTMRSVLIPEGVSAVGQEAFLYCTQLKAVDLPSTVYSIGNNAFKNCSGVSTIVIRVMSPPSIASATLTGLPSTAKIYVPAEAVDTYKTRMYWSARAAQIYPMED